MARMVLAVLLAACGISGAVAAEGAVAAPAVESTAPAAPAMESTAPVAARRAATVAEEFPVTVAEVQALLARGESPRLRVVNRFKSTATGRAAGFRQGKLLLDVTGEGIGIDGVLGVETANIVSLAVIVPMTQGERDAARQATEQYMAGLRVGAPVPGLPQLPEPGAPGDGVPAPGTAQAVAGALEGAGADRDLLAIYPPAEGWGPTRLAEITRKAVVLHLEPAGMEKEFLRDYELWRASYERKRADQMDELARLQAAGATVPEDFSILPELEPVPALEGAASPATSQPVGDDSAQAPSPAPTGQ